jgi:uncharacterized lipoprotein YbaY
LCVFAFIHEFSGGPDRCKSGVSPLAEKKMFKPLVGRAALCGALLAMAACAQAPREANPVLSQPLPPPGPNVSGGPIPQSQYAAPPQAGPRAGAQDIVLRGAAFAASGTGAFPPSSRMTVRVYDAAVGDVNDWVAEQSYTRSGALPWPYEMRFRTEALNGVVRPALAARIEGPDGRLYYRSERAVPLVEGGSEDIPMSAVSAGGAVSLPGAQGQYVGAPVQRGAQSSYGIPDDRASYGAPSYDAPVYPGQTYEPTSISGPPSNSIF